MRSAFNPASSSLKVYVEIVSEKPAAAATLRAGTGGRRVCIGAGDWSIRIWWPARSPYTHYINMYVHIAVCV